MNREVMVQARVVAIYRAAVCEVYNLSQGYRPGGRRHGTTRQTKGLPDLYVLLPRRGLAWWQEVKAPDDLADLDLPDEARAAIYRKKQSPEQRAFEEHCRQCAIAYILGGAAEAEQHLDRLGLLAHPMRIAP